MNGQSLIYSRFHMFLYRAYIVVMIPFSILSLWNSKKIHPAYKMSAFKKLKLTFQMLRNNLLIPTESIYTLHLAMALKILETPPETPGDILECGTYKGGSAANLSLVCRIVGRKLRIYDSFEGLPAIRADDRGVVVSADFKEGAYKGPLEEVKKNITKGGAIECCEFVKGWYKDTLPSLKSPILLAFLDVDLEDSLDTCVKCIWPNLVEDGYLFTHEAFLMDYVALFYSEKWWKQNFNRTPPGYVGAGTGIALGTYYVGPYTEMATHPLQHTNAGGYTQKSLSGYWQYYPDEADGLSRSPLPG